MTFAVQKSVSKQRIEDSRLLNYASQKRAEGFFNDVTIKVGNECFPANRMVLSCYSKYFENMFQTPMRERYENSTEIQSVDERSMKIIIDYFYTGNIVIDNENVAHLLSAADYLAIDEVKQYCFEFLESIITPGNCFEIWNLAKFYGNNLLKSSVYETIEGNLSDVSKTTSFKELIKAELISCFSNLNRNRTQETSLYEAIISWIKHDEESRKQEFHELFQLLNLDQLPEMYLANVVAKEDLVQQSNQCLNMLTNYFAQNLKIKLFKESGSKIISIGGVHSLSKVTDIYDITDTKKKTFQELPIKLARHSSLNFDESVYCIGGDIDGVTTDQVWKMCLSQDQLSRKRVTSLKTARCLLGAAVYKDTMVVAGGYFGGNILSSTECYLKVFDEWKAIVPMRQARYGHALVACDDCLYAVGGWDDKRIFSSVEQISDLKGTWEFVESMKTPRKWLAAVNCKGAIYAIAGGNDDSYSLKTVEKYDPAEKKWVYVSDMNIERCAHAACVLHDKIYVVGGLDKEKKAVKAIDCYDPSRDEWSIVGEKNEKLFHHSLVVL